MTPTSRPITPELRNIPLTFLDCPDREEHIVTGVAICKNRNNKPPYFQGFQYCDLLKWDHRSCPRGYALNIRGTRGKDGDIFTDEMQQRLEP